MFDSNKVLRDLQSQLATKKWIKEEAAKANGADIKIVPEHEQRSRLIKLAQAQGCSHELQMIFDKYDSLLKNCTNKKEKAHIAYLGVTECARLLNTAEDLIVNGYIVHSNKETDYDIANKKKV
jgi:hypothetical protein